MAVDYGQLYKTQFSNDQDLRLWKRRAWVKLKGLDPGDIVAGYELLAGKTKKFLPTVLDIAEYAVQTQKIRKQAEKNAKEAERLAALPPPNVAADKPRLFALMREHLSGIDKKLTPEEDERRLLRLAQKCEGHEALVQKDFPGLGKTYLAPGHECQVGFCRDPGVLSHSTTGGNYYCKEHFRKA